MTSRQRKVQRHRQKRQQKKRQSHVFSLRRKQRLASNEQPLYASMVNHDWREDGKASIFFARSVGPASVTMAAFLVDLWAMGLKDAWGRVDIPVSEFQKSLDSMDERLGTGPLNVATAKDIVYGGIELARELGFRLPRRYQRWTAILGPLPEGKGPDMSLFRADGKIRLVCSMRDLGARLVGTTPEQFLARPDVEYLLGDDDFTLVDEDDDEVEAMVERLEEAFLARAGEWCFAHGQAPHPLLPRVIGAMLESIYQCAPNGLDEDDDVPALSGPAIDEVNRQMEAFLSASFCDQPNELEAALRQFQAFMHSMDSPEALFKTLGVEGIEAPDDR